MKRRYLLLATALLACAIPASAQPATRPAATITYEHIIHDLDYRRPQPERLIITLRVTPDPADKIAFMQRTVQPQKAVDDKGNSLVPTAPIPADLKDSTSYGGISELVIIVLQPSANLGKSVTTLDGVIAASTIGNTDPIEISAPGNDKRSYPDNVKATFTVTMTNATTCKVEYAFDIPANVPDPQRQVWISQMPSLKITALSPDNVTWRPSGGGSSSTSATRWTVTQSFSPPPNTPAGPAPKITFNVIAETKPTTIPFHLENIPLP